MLNRASSYGNIRSSINTTRTPETSEANAKNPYLKPHIKQNNQNIAVNNCFANRTVTTTTPLNRSEAEENTKLKYALLGALYDCNTDKIIAIASQLKDINQDIDNGKSILHFVVAEENLTAVKAIISLRANINLADNKKITPLHIATKTGNCAILKTLLSHPHIDTENRISNGKTALFLAPNAETVQALLKAGADIHAKTQNGFTPLHYFVYTDNHEIVQELIKHGADIEAGNLSEVTPLHIAALHSRNHCAEILLANTNTDVNHIDIYNRTTLHIAFKNGNIELIKMLLAHPRINLNGQSFNIDFEIDIIPEIKTALINLIVEKGMKVEIIDFHGKSLLQQAVAYNIEELVIAQINNGHNIENRDINGSTALHTAVHYDHKNMVEILIKNSANINAENKLSYTPLHLSVYNKSPEITSILLAYNADETIQDKYGRTWADIKSLKELKQQRHQQKLFATLSSNKSSV